MTSLVFWAGIAVAIAFLSGIRIVFEYTRLVRFRFGKYKDTLKPGLRWIIPAVDTAVKMDLRVTTVDVDKQEVMTKDNVPAKVNAVVFFKVSNAEKAVIEVQNYRFAISQLAQTTLRDVIGKVDLDTVLSNREKLGEQIRKHIDEVSDPWGIKVESVEIKDVELPDTMKRAMAAQAESERTRRSRIILSEGELQAAEKLSEAGEIIARHPAALQLRLFETMSDIAAEKNSTIIMPVPIELLEFFKGFKKDNRKGERNA